MQSTSVEPKRTAAFYLPVALLDALAELARVRGTNKGYELARLAASGLAADAEAREILAAGKEGRAA